MFPWWFPDLSKVSVRYVHYLAHKPLTCWWCHHRMLVRRSLITDTCAKWVRGGAVGSGGVVGVGGSRDTGTRYGRGMEGSDAGSQRPWSFQVFLSEWCYTKPWIKDILSSTLSVASRRLTHACPKYTPLRYRVPWSICGSMSLCYDFIYVVLLFSNLQDCAK